MSSSSSSASELRHLAAGAALGAALTASAVYVLQRRRGVDGVRGVGGGVGGGAGSLEGLAEQIEGGLAGGAAAAMAPSDFLAWGGAMLRWIVRYRTEDALTGGVVSRVSPNYLIEALPDAAPEQGEGWAAIMRDLDTLIVPGLTHWEASNRFFAYFKPHASYPAVMGELLCAGLNVMGFDWIASPACTELEMVALDWLAKLLCLPPKFLSKGRGGGVIQGSAGEAAIVVLLAAAVRANAKHGAGGESGDGGGGGGDDGESGKGGEGGGAAALAAPAVPRHRMVVYCSDQAHAVCQKACMVLGLQFRCVPTSKADGFALRGEPLRRAVAADAAAGLVPIAVCATTGTTSSCAFDALREVAAVCRDGGGGGGGGGGGELWLHIDAAYGGAYACLPELAHCFDGIELADSIVVNAHKKLLCPFDLAALYLADRRPVLDALSLQPEYLRNAASASGAVTDFEHLQLPLGRRFRALKLWFVLRRFGAEGIRAHLRQGVALREAFERRLAASGGDDGGRFELAAPPSLSLVCFRWRWPRKVEPSGASAAAVLDEEACNAAQIALKEAVNATGECFIIQTKLGGTMVLRVACGGLEQEVADVEKAYAVIEREAQRLEGEGWASTA